MTLYENCTCEQSIQLSLCLAITGTLIFTYPKPPIHSLIILAHHFQNPNISHLQHRARMESRNQVSEHHDNMDGPPTLSHFIANAPLEGNFYRQIRADIAECDRFGLTISPQIIDHDAYLNLLSQSSDWRRKIEAFQRTLRAFAPAEELLDHASGLDISDDLEVEFHKMEHQIDDFCEEVRKYKYRISRIIRLPLYVHCLAVSQRRHLEKGEMLSDSCIRDSDLPDIPRVGVNEQAIDNDVLLKHLTELHRVDSVVKEWMFTAKIVKSAISIKKVGWNIDHLELFDQIRLWVLERLTTRETKKNQEAFEEVLEKLKYTCEEAHDYFQGALDDATQQGEESQQARDRAIKEKEELQEVLDQANKQKENTQKALEEATKQKDKIQEQFRLKSHEVADLRKVLDFSAERDKKALKALHQAKKQQDEMQKALEQAVMRAKDLDIAIKASITFPLAMLSAWLLYKLFSPLIYGEW